jgi:hypothetical protein
MTTTRFKTGVVKKQLNVGSLLNQALVQSKITECSSVYYLNDVTFPTICPVRYLTWELRQHISRLPRELSQLFAYHLP